MDLKYRAVVGAVIAALHFLAGGRFGFFLGGLGEKGW